MLKVSRDPALYLALFASVVSLLAAFVVHLTDTQQTLLNAGASAGVGLVVALWVRHDGQVAAILGVAQAALSLAVGFGAHVSAENQSLILTAVASAVAMFVRTQVVAPVNALGDRSSAAALR